MNKKYELIALILILLTTVSLLFYKAEDISSELRSLKTVSISPRVFGQVDGNRIMPTHIYFDEVNSKEIISDFVNNRFIHRKIQDDFDRSTWSSTSNLNLAKPHAITFEPTLKQYFAVDTSNHRIVGFNSLETTADQITEFKEVGGYSVGRRPHDIAYNDHDGYIYVLINKGILRFKATRENLIDVSFHSKAELSKAINSNKPNSKFTVGYMRSLTIVDGVIYLVNSTQGNVIQLNQFNDPSTWVAHINIAQPQKYSESGSFEGNGLILNDIDFYEGYWYATNYYVGNKHRYWSDASVSKNKLIRWKTWEDFYKSNWEDLSHLVHPESVPYYFTTYDDRLFLSMFHIGNEAGEGSGVYEIVTSYF